MYADGPVPYPLRVTRHETDLRDREIPLAGDLSDGGPVAVPDGAQAPAEQRRRPSRFRRVILVLATSILAGGALSMVPRADRVVTHQVTPIGSTIGTVEMRMTETSRGIPLRTWSLRRGPAEEEIKTHAHFALSVTAIVLNMAIVAVTGLLVLANVGSRKPEG
jgi:hypothetical protein